MKKAISWVLAMIIALAAPIFSVVAAAESSTSSSSSTTTASSGTTVSGSVYGHDEDDEHDDDEHDNEDHDGKGKDNNNGNGHKYGHDKEKKYEAKYTGIDRALQSLLKVLEDGKGTASDETIQAVIDKLTAMLKADGTVGSDQEATDAVQEKIETDVEAGTATDESVEVLATMQVDANKADQAQENVETALQKKPSSDKLYRELTKVLKEKGDTQKTKVYVQGKKPVFDVEPYEKDYRNMVPVRAISEALGAQVKWDEATQTVSIVKDGTTIELPLGSNTIKVNGVTKTIDAPAETKNYRTFVPVRFISEFLGHDVNWDQDTKTVMVK